MSHTCSYCGLPVGRSWRHEPADDEQLFCCYGCQFASEVTGARGESGAAVWALTKLGLAIFFTLNVVCFTMALWTDAVYGESQETLAVSYSELLRWLGLLFSLPVLLLLGGPLLSNAINDLRRGRLSTDLLLMSGVLAAFGYSATSVVRGDGDVYFEVGCVILVTVTLGRWLEAASKLKATQALDELERLLPERVRLIADDGRECSIPLVELVPPAVVRVIPGERFPADGVLLSAAVSVDEQILTGESWSITKQHGDRLFAGTLNLDGDVRLSVTAAPSQTAIARLIAAVRAARELQGPYQRLSDRVSSWFFPAIALVALITFAIHAERSSFEQGVMSALAVVLIACPCSLSLATPLAVWTAIGHAAKRGVLFRHGEAIERLAEIRELCLDKTGTLTTGEARVARILIDKETSKSDVIAISQALAGSSTHSFSRAILDWSPAKIEARPDMLADIRALSGLGVIGRWSNPVPEFLRQAEAIRPLRSSTATVARRTAQTVSDRPQAHADVVLLGNLRLVEQCGFEINDTLRTEIGAAIERGEPLTLVGWSGRVRGAFVFEETLRPSACELLEWCRHEEMPVTVLTGDHGRRGQRLAEELGTPVHAELLPDQKAEFIRQRESHMPVGMVGDGVNDAGAITAAHVGVSLGAGTDVSRDAAAVCLLNNDLAQLPWAIGLARRTVSTIRRNLFWSFGYNAIGVLLAAAGWLNPIIAALLMVVSSSVVVRQSSRLD